MLYVDRRNCNNGSLIILLPTGVAFRIHFDPREWGLCLAFSLQMLQCLMGERKKINQEKKKSNKGHQFKH